ncbi:fungal-specific transcription factor domain-containing protein [Tirmania nivea]|nr:fungal-specific transcription factor domain-containing protein [Tirmania nivea]
MVCEFKQSTSSRSKGNSAAPENETGHDRNLEDYHTSEIPSTYVREDEMCGVAELKREGDNDMHGMDDIPAIVPAKPSTSLRQEKDMPVTQTTVCQPAQMFIPDVMNADLSAASRISEVSQLGDNTREIHVREMAAQWQGSMPRPRHSSVGSGVTATPGLGSSPSSPVSTEVYQYTPRRYYHSTRSRSTPIASTPTPLSIPGPMGEDTRDHLLPEPKALEHLCTLYFTHLYSQHYPFLHRGNFMANMETHRPVLLFSLCAIASRFSPQYRDKEEEFAVQARQRILDNFDVQKLEVVQAMVLMGLHDFGSHNGHKAWMFAGMAVRLGSALKLHMEPKSEKEQSPIEIEVQRRTYWSYYLMDRLNSYGVSRPFLIQDHDCHIQLPCDQDSFENGRRVKTEYLGGKNPNFPNVGNGHMGAFAYLVRITSIWGDVLKYMHLSGCLTDDTKEKLPEYQLDANYTKFVDRLKEWNKSLPKCLRYSIENLGVQIKAGTVGTYIMMHAMFHTCAIYVHRYVMPVTIPEGGKEFITQDISKENIAASICKIFAHAEFVIKIMEDVWERKEEAEKNGDRPVTVVAPFLGHAALDACLVGVIQASLDPAGVKATEAQRRRFFVAISWLKELKKYWRPIEAMYSKLCQARKKMEKINKPAKSVELTESSSGTGSASVSPKQGLQLDNNFIPSPDSAGQQNLVPYQQGSSLQFAYENAAYAGDLLQTMQYTHLSDLIYNVPYLYYDAINEHGAMYQLTEYAMDLDLYSNVFPGLVSPSTPHGVSLEVDMTAGLDQQQSLQNPMAALHSSVLAQSPTLSSSLTHGHSHSPYLDHSRSQNEAASPAQSPTVDSLQEATDSGEEEDGEDDVEDDNQEEKPEEFGHRYFEPRTTRNRMEIFHYLNSEAVKEGVREAVEAPSANALESDDGDADGEKEHCISGVSGRAVGLEEGESSNST